MYPFHGHLGPETAKCAIRPAQAADGTFARSGTVRVADSCLSGGQACPRSTHRTSRRMGTRASYRLVIFGPTYTTYSGSAACTGHEK